MTLTFIYRSDFCGYMYAVRKLKVYILQAWSTNCLYRCIQESLVTFWRFCCDCWSIKYIAQKSPMHVRQYLWLLNTSKGANLSVSGRSRGRIDEERKPTRLCQIVTRIAKAKRKRQGFYVYESCPAWQTEFYSQRSNRVLDNGKNLKIVRSKEFRRQECHLRVRTENTFKDSV